MTPTNRELLIILRLRDKATAAFQKASTVWGRSLIRLKKLAAAAMKALAALAAVGIAAVTVAFTMGMRAAGRYMLELDRLNKITGVSTERLGRLIYAMEQEHGSRQALEKGLIALTHGLGEAAEGLASFTDAFDVLGIAYRDNEGNVKTADRLMMDLADRFHQGALTTEEQAAAMMLLGRRVYGDLVPFLKLGTEHIEALGDQGERLGVVIGGDVVAAAKRFDDEMTEIRTGIRGVWLAIKTGLLPHLEDLAKWFADEMPGIVKGAKDFGDAIGEWVRGIKDAEGAWETFKAILGIPPDEIAELLAQLDRVNKRIEEFRWEIERVREMMKIPLLGRLWGAELKLWESLLDEALQKHKALQEQINELLEVRYPMPPLPQLDAHIEAYREYLAKKEAMDEAMEEVNLERQAEIAAKRKELEEELSLKLIGITEGRMAMEMEALTRHYEALKEKYPELAELYNKLFIIDMNELIAKYKEHTDIMVELAKETAKKMQQSMSTFFFDAITGQLKTTEDYMRAFGRAMARMLAELLAQQAMLRLFGAQGGIFPAIGKLIGLSKGGRIGQGQVQPLPQAQAGAMVARGRAVPIIAHEGEWIGTPARLAAAGIGAGRDSAPVFNISINAIDTQSFEERLAQHPDVFEGAIVQAMMKSKTIRHITRRYA